MATVRSAFHVTRLAAIAAVLFTTARQPVDAASFVKMVGSRTRGVSTVANSATTVNAPSNGVAAGDSILVTVHVASLGGTIACSDNVNGAYNTDVVSPAGAGAGIAIASKHNVMALGFGDVISCSYPAFDGASSMSVYEFSGLEPVNPLDGTSQGSSASGFLVSSGLTATTVQANELVFGFVWLPGATQVFTPATSGGNPFEIPYSPPWSSLVAAGTQKPIYRFVNSTRQYEANGTVGPTGGWMAQIATYRLLPDLCATVDCDDGNTCTADTCDPSTGACSHDPEPLGLSCGNPTSGICDSADRCDGAGTCLANNVPDGTQCGEVDSDCQIAPSCLAGLCHDNGVRPEGSACGDPQGNECDAADSCNASGFCLNNRAADGTACGDAASACVNADSCFAGACHDNGFVAAGSACGDASSGECDAADSCDGSGACRDNHVADGTLCGDAGSECTNQDSCVAGSCEDAGFPIAGTACGDSSSGPCDNADSCDGAGSCSPNHVAGGTACNDAEACTNADACDGSGLCAGTRDELCFACIGNVGPIVSPAVVAIPAEPVPLASGLVSVTASFTDAPDQSWTCTIDWGDGSAPDGGVVTAPTETEAGSCTGSHLYTAVGVYPVSISLTDMCGESAGAVYQYAVVYDPSGGFVTGAGWIDSPPGAYTGNPALTGRAHFGFVSAYRKGNSTTPSGRTDFHFSVANFDFSSTTYDWLVISGAKARFRGTGQVNGAGSYGFALTAWDGEAPGGDGTDKFRIKIWDENQGDAVVYDNQIVCPNQGDNADPCTALGAGAIVIQKK